MSPYIKRLVTHWSGKGYLSHELVQEKVCLTYTAPLEVFLKTHCFKKGVIISLTFLQKVPAKGNILSKVGQEGSPSVENWSVKGFNFPDIWFGYRKGLRHLVQSQCTFCR